MLLLEKIKFTGQFIDFPSQELKQCWSQYKTARKGLKDIIKTINANDANNTLYFRTKQHLGYEAQTKKVVEDKNVLAPFFSASYDDIIGKNLETIKKYDKRISNSTGYEVVLDNLQGCFKAECGVKVGDRVYGIFSKKVIYEPCDNLVLTEISDVKYIGLIEYFVRKYIKVTANYNELHNLYFIKRYLSEIRLT